MGRVAAALIDDEGLTPKQSAFVNAVVETKDLSAAARKVYKTSSPASARAIGHQVMVKPAVRNAIEKRVRERGITPEGILEDLAYVVERGKQTDKLGEVINASVWLGKNLRMFQESDESEKILLAAVAMLCEKIPDASSRAQLIEQLRNETSSQKALEVKSNDPQKLAADSLVTPNDSAKLLDGQKADS